MVLSEINANEDIQSLMQLLTYGLKGLAAYAEHAAVLGSTDNGIFAYIAEAFAALIKEDITVDELVALNMKCGEVNIQCMAILNEAHIKHFGTPEPTSVHRNRPQSRRAQKLDPPSSSRATISL